MSAERLREAARLMRERAQAATPGPWEARTNAVQVPNLVNMRWEPATFAVVHSDEEPSPDGANSEHIASWHPVVALAVADWLDQEIRACTGSDGVTDDDMLSLEALAVADAYLGGAS